MGPRHSIRLGARVVAVVALTLALAWALVLGRRGDPVQAEALYVGRDRCASCHVEQAEAWAGSHHDLAMQEATEATVLGDFEGAELVAGDVTSEFYRADGRFFTRTEGPDGQLADYEIAYTFGAIPLQQYLVAFPGGRYQALGIAWDSRPAAQGGQRWFHLYPGEDIGPDDPLHWTRGTANWNYGCAECHSTGLVKGFDLATRSYRTAWSEIDVSCEACHGPGSTHVGVAEARAGRSRPAFSWEGSASDWGLTVDLEDAGRVWTPNAGATTAQRGEPRASDVEIETCAHCHSRRAPIADGRVAGQPLLDTEVPSLLREGLYHADGQILEEVYVYGSFVQSKMYAAGVTCSDCHDPHTLELRAEGNALCTQCHLASNYDVPTHHFHEIASSGARCVECHMPSTTYMVVDRRRDHSLRIPRPDLSESIGVPNACNACHEDRSTAWAAQVIADRRGPSAGPRSHFAEVIHAGRNRLPAAAPALAELAADTAQPAIARATALTLLASYPATPPAGVVRTGLNDPDPLVRLGALQALASMSPAVVSRMGYPLLGDSLKAVRIEAARLLAALPRSSWTGDQAETVDRVVAEYERAQAVNGDHPSAWVNLGDLYSQRGLADEGEAAYRNALALDSTYVAAHLNYADLLRATGRDGKGEEVLLAALRVAPSTPEVHHALGLLRVRQGETEAALRSLKQAVDSAPANARFAYVYGVALGSSGDVAEGVRVLEAALLRQPYDPELLTALSTYSRDLGAGAAALAYAERLVEVLPEDDGARQLLSQLRARPR